jgi:bacillithiol system protein YtxJ
MGFIKNLFSSNESTGDSNRRLPWLFLNALPQLDEIKEVSQTKTVLIFKHSTRCGVSSMAHKEFEKSFQPNENTVLYFLDLLAHRDISDAIAAHFRVQHQSPQLLVIEKGVCTRHASHYDIGRLSETI